MAFTARDLESLDPLRLDREVRSAALAVRADARAIEGGEGMTEPLVFSERIVTTRTAFEAVTDLPASDPLREALRRWIFRLAVYRINRDAMVRAAIERRGIERVVNEPERAKLPLAAMLARALSDPRRQEAWLSSFLKAAEPLGDAELLVLERRAEIAVRMGSASLDQMETPSTDAVGVARRFLVETEDLFDEVLERHHGNYLDAAMARGAEEAFPRHLLPRTLLDLFRETDLFRALTLDPGRLPAAFGPASFVRALLRVGAAWADATAPQDQPFVIAHDAYGLRRRTVGALFGGLPGSESFARRALGLDVGRSKAHVRALSGSFLLGARLAALRVALRPAVLPGRKAFRSLFEDETRAALGVALPPRAAGAIVRLGADDVQRFAGILLAATHAARLRDEYDDDWYRNPRAIERLRDEARLSPVHTTTDDVLAEGARALVNSLTDGMG